MTGVGGIFDVHVDGDLVPKSMLGRYPDPDDVVPPRARKARRLSAVTAPPRSGGNETATCSLARRRALLH